jgi:hypothetical protein
MLEGSREVALPGYSLVIGRGAAIDEDVGSQQNKKSRLTYST